MCNKATRRCAVTMLTVLSLAAGGETGTAQSGDGAATGAGAILLKRTSAAAPVRGSAEETSTDLVWPRVNIRDVFTADATRGALRGASERLAKPACQSMFSEFRDGRGLPLTAKLDELGASLQGYLRLIVFLDGARSAQCKRGVLAYTSQNSRVVYLCGREFEKAARRDPGEAQITIIHEVLHTLGLGENPPSPGSISYRVLQRCSE
jgi:hypothetical protein